jgi:hypothetical protein
VRDSRPRCHYGAGGFGHDRWPRRLGRFACTSRATAKTDWNQEHRLSGVDDRPLNDLGRRQAADLAESMKGVISTRFIPARLSRSRDTAQTVAGTSMTVKSLPRSSRAQLRPFIQGGSEHRFPPTWLA